MVCMILLNHYLAEQAGIAMRAGISITWTIKMECTLITARSPEVNEIVWAYHHVGAEAPILIITRP